MGTAMSSAALVPRHSAVGPSLRAMLRISASDDGCAGGGLGLPAFPLPFTRQSSGAGHSRQGAAWQLMKPHLLRARQRQCECSGSLTKLQML